MNIGKVRLLPLHGYVKVRHQQYEGKYYRRHCALTRQHRRWLKIGFIFTVGCLVLALLSTLIPFKQWLADITKWIQTNRTTGAIMLPLMFWVAIPLCIPSVMFEVLAGSTFGMVYGVMLNMIGKCGGVLIAFTMGKKLGKAKIGSYMESNFPSFTTMSTMLESSSWKPIMLIQLSSIPYSIKSYGLSITDVSMYRFTVSSIIGNFMHAVIWTYIGYQAEDFVSSAQTTSNSSRSTEKLVVMIVGGIFTVVSMVWLVVYTKQQLHQEMLKVAKHKDCNTKMSDEFQDMEMDEFDFQVKVESEPTSSPFHMAPKHRACVVV